MPLHEQLTLKNLHLLDMGRPAAAFELALEQAVKDCQARPYDGKPRKVTFQMTLTPSKEEENRVDVSAQTKVSVPAWQTKTYEMIPTTRGQLKFNPDLPDEPDGTTLYDQEEREEDFAS